MEVKKKLCRYYNYTVVLTYLGMLSGFTGILLASEGAFREAMICLMMAGVCDMFDGAVASTMKRNERERHFGIQIDSLSDLICFGALPAVFVYQICNKSYPAFWAACFYVLCALIRLAYFNVMEEERQRLESGQRTEYTGLPVTTSALLLPLCFVFGSRMASPFLGRVLAELTLSFLLFLLFVLLGIRAKMDYIRTLSSEIEILEGGSLDYKITVKGKDELTALAESLDQMRLSFCNLINSEAKIVQENQKTVTEMSHDLRTPVTSILLYTEILKKGKYGGEEQMKEYIEKIDRKAHRMKQLTDNLFEYSLVTGGNEISLEAPESFSILFYDLFSETCSYLEQKGFLVEPLTEWKDCPLRVNTDYVTRIMDNLTSNMIKYADPEKPVLLRSVYRDGMAGFALQNAVAQTGRIAESTGIGVSSIRSMMKKMGGTCSVWQSDKAGQSGSSFQVEILFPICEEELK